jgi:hypothetical protein
MLLTLLLYTSCVGLQCMRPSPEAPRSCLVLPRASHRPYLWQESIAIGGVEGHVAPKAGTASTLESKSEFTEYSLTEDTLHVSLYADKHHQIGTTKRAACKKTTTCTFMPDILNRHVLAKGVYAYVLASRELGQ